MERIFITLLLMVIGNVTPAIRESLVGVLKTLEAEAKKTSNPWDDIFVSFLRVLLGA